MGKAAVKEILDVRVVPMPRWRSRYQLRLAEGGIEVRVPAHWSPAQVEEIRHKHRRWVQARQREAGEKQDLATADAAVDWCLLPDSWWRKAGQRILPAMLDDWAKVMGVHVVKMRLTGARTRWGSCTAQGVISLSWRLLQVPRPLAEYVVVHELAHRRVFDHSPRFWREVERWLPDYEARRDELRTRAKLVL